ncbi:hypothetical protein ACP70R_035856 [Stipagrostis hirtigluma subsp. patula]
MADGDHHGGVAREVAEAPAATATTSCGASCDEEEEEEGFTFAAVPCPAAVGGAFPDGRVGPVYPVFGRPRSPPVPEEEEDPGTATVRIPLGQLLLEERGGAGAQSWQPDDGELDGVPAETYCLWSPGGSPALASQSSPARCRKSGSTGSVLRWRQRLVGRSHSDGKEKFVFLSAASSERSAGGGHEGWSNQGRGGGDGGRKSFLPYKRDLVGLFANAGAFRRTYHPF